MKILLVFLFAMYMLISCQENRNENLSIIKFAPEQEVQSIHETQLIKDCKIVPLQTDSNVLIGTIDKTILYEDKLYVGDFNKTQSLYIFDLKGKFIHKISKQGRGPEEYLQFFDFFIDKSQKTLNLLSRIDRKLLIFDIGSYKLLKVKEMPKAFVKIESHKKGYVGYSGNYSEDPEKSFNIWFLNENFEIIKSAFEISPTWESKTQSGINLFSTYKDTLYYMAPMDFNVYNLNHDKITSTHYIDFGKFSWPGKETTYLEYREIIRKNTDYINKIYHFQETDDFFICMIAFNSQQRLFNNSIV